MKEALWLGKNKRHWREYWGRRYVQDPKKPELFCENKDELRDALELLMKPVNRMVSNRDHQRVLKVLKSKGVFTQRMNKNAIPADIEEIWYEILFIFAIGEFFTRNDDYSYIFSTSLELLEYLNLC